MKFISALLLVIVCGAVIALTDPTIQGVMHGFVISTLALLGVLYRKVLGAIVGAMVLLLVPYILRVYFKKQYVRLVTWAVSVWKWFDWRVRIALIILPFLVAAIPMFVSGGTLWLIAFFTGNAATAVWVRAFAIPWLAKKAAGAGMTRIAVALWALMPTRARTWCEKRYVRLWWKTMLRIARNKRKLGNKVKNFKFPPFEGPRYVPLP